ncbi:MAG: hypothetical protein ACR2N5_05185, partial [Solirubrobacterales bacterium]
AKRGRSTLGHSEAPAHTAAESPSAPPSGPGDRSALWAAGVVAGGARGPAGTQLALALTSPKSPDLGEPGRWERIVAGYETIGIALDEHPMALIRERLHASSKDSRDLRSHPNDARIELAGMVVARQRPETASGIVFMLLEDEWGVANLVVPGRVYEEHRLVARTAPFILIIGRLERREGVVNVVAEELHELSRPELPKADVRHTEPPPDRERDRPDRFQQAGSGTGLKPVGAGVAASSEPGMVDLVAALPPGHSFGRRGR